MVGKSIAQRRLKLAAVSMVRDEADIMELFIKINSRTFDRMYILDHRSTDGTAAIIQKLIDDGYPVSYVRYEDEDFQQSKVVTHLVNQVAAMGAFDYIVPLDADEFLSPGEGASLQELDRHLGPDQWGKAPWRTYCPVQGEYFGEGAPLYERFRPRRQESTRMQKVVLGAQFARGCTVLEGNHKAYNLDMMSEAVALPLYFNHVPMRHRDQIFRKALLGAQTLKLKTNRFPNEGAHWERLAHNIRQRKYDTDDAWLRDAALNYVNALRIPDNSIDMDGPRLGESTDVMVYKDLAQRPLVAAMDDYIAGLVHQIQTLRAQLPKDSL